MRERKLQIFGHELLEVWALDIRVLLNFDNLEDLNFGKENTLDFCQKTFQRGIVTHMDRPETGAVPGGHILVEGLDGIGARKLTVLLVHVVGSAAGVIADPDSKVLDFLRTLLMNLSPVNLQPFFLLDGFYLQVPSMCGPNTAGILEAEFCMANYLCASERPY